MKKLVALFGALALAACAGDDADDAVVVEETPAVVAPAAEPAPVVETTVVDTTMAVDPAMTPPAEEPVVTQP